MKICGKMLEPPYTSWLYLVITLIFSSLQDNTSELLTEIDASFVHFDIVSISLLNTSQQGAF